jgi:hypothetical protein
VLVIGALTTRIGLYEALGTVAAIISVAALVLAAVWPRSEPAPA